MQIARLWALSAQLSPPSSLRELIAALRLYKVLIYSIRYGSGWEAIQKLFCRISACHWIARVLVGCAARHERAIPSVCSCPYDSTATEIPARSTAAIKAESADSNSGSTPFWRSAFIIMRRN